MKNFKSFVEAHNKNLYYVQPDGRWKRGADRRSEGKKKEDLPAGAKISEMSRKDLNPQFTGKSTGEIRKMANDMRKYSPTQRAAAKKELQMRSQVREDSELEEKTFNQQSADHKKNFKPDNEKTISRNQAAGRLKSARKIWKKKTPGNNPERVKQRARDARSDATMSYTKKGTTVYKADKKVNEMTGGGAMGGAPGNNTRSGPGMGDDNTLRTRKARLFKDIYRRFHTKKEDTTRGVYKP